MMDPLDMGWMGLAMVAAAIVVATTIAVIAVALLRAGGAEGEVEDRSAKSLLDRRLALGEIDAEEYYERESALRSATPVGRRGRGGQPR